MIGVDKVKGVGPKSSMILNKMNINTVMDLVSHYPYRYDVIKKSDLSVAEEDEKVIIDGKIDSVPILLRLKGNLNKMNLRVVTTDKMVVGVSIFNRAFLKKNFTVGTNITVFGVFKKSKNIIMASDIRLGLLPRGEKIEAVYHGTVGMTSKNISSYINVFYCAKIDFIKLPIYIPGRLKKNQVIDAFKQICPKKLNFSNE